MNNTRKVQWNGHQFTTTIPEQVVEHMNLQKGDILNFIIDKESVDVSIIKIKIEQNAN